MVNISRWCINDLELSNAIVTSRKIGTPWAQTVHDIHSQKSIVSNPNKLAQPITLDVSLRRSTRYDMETSIRAELEASPTIYIESTQDYVYEDKKYCWIVPLGMNVTDRGGTGPLKCVISGLIDERTIHSCDFNTNWTPQGSVALYEHYDENDDGSSFTYAANWRAQSFTIGNVGLNETHDIRSVSLKLCRSGVGLPTPGTVTVSITTVDGDGKPTGDDLATGTTDGNTLPVTPTTEWRNIILTAYTLVANTQYAIVVRAPDGDTDNYLIWRMGSPTYTGGTFLYSTNSGSSWSANSEYDRMFREYGALVNLSISTDTRFGANSLKGIAGEGAVFTATYTPPSALDLSNVTRLHYWIKTSQASGWFDTCRMEILTDSNYNGWDATTFSADTWSYQTCDLASPDTSSGAVSTDNITSIRLRTNPPSATGYSIYIAWVWVE